MAKSYEELTLADDFMFCKVMTQNPDLCRELTELITGRKVGGILKINKRMPVEITADGRGVGINYASSMVNTEFGASHRDAS